ncbi:hypothetical protein [Streptomyces sp. NPDC058665]
MTKRQQPLVATQCWISTFPGAALLLILVLVDLVGEQIHDRLDPRLKRF